LRGIGFDPNALRASKETQKGYLHIEHLLELNDILIAALKVLTLDSRLYVARYEHERELNRHCYRHDPHIGRSSNESRFTADSYR
jgi:hypothetical protein